MSKYNEYIKTAKDNDLQWFFGDIEKKSNKYFSYNPVHDNDTIIILTNNIKFIKGNAVLVVDNNKAVYLKDWQIREVHNYYNGINAYAVKLNRNYFNPYTFRFNFDDMAFDQEDTFDSLMEAARTQITEIAIGHMR